MTRGSGQLSTQQLGDRHFTCSGTSLRWKPLFTLNTARRTPKFTDTTSLVDAVLRAPFLAPLFLAPACRVTQGGEQQRLLQESTAEILK